MAGFFEVLKTVAFMALLVFGTHFIRTWAFKRYEAVTFECSSAALLFSMMMLWKYGYSAQRLLLFILLLIMFAANAYSQWHFYMKLQTRIGEAFGPRSRYLQEHPSGVREEGTVTEDLGAMASVAVMPSFSRFIEESDVFNNPGNIIGLLKSLMKRDRFQNKKYQMRDSFAENINLIGPCRPTIEDEPAAGEGIPGAVHANDLALESGDEMLGLALYDILGFGAAAIIIVAVFRASVYRALPRYTSPGPGSALLACLAALAYTLLCHVFRHFAFARYESFFYELSFTALAVVSFRLIDRGIAGVIPEPSEYIVLGSAAAVFLAMSFINRHCDKVLRIRANRAFDSVINRIPYDTETGLVKRRFLRNLRLISDWAVTPFAPSGGDGPSIDLFEETGSLKKFRNINKKKRDMPQLMAKMIGMTVPELGGEVKEEDFRLDDSMKKRFSIVSAVLGTAAFAGAFVCIALGLI